MTRRGDAPGAREASDRADVVHAAPEPAHEAFDVVEFVGADGLARRYMFDVVSVPLDSSGALTATARETVVT